MAAAAAGPGAVPEVGAAPGGDVVEALDDGDAPAAAVSSITPSSEPAKYNTKMKAIGTRHAAKKSTGWSLYMFCESRIVKKKKKIKK